MQQSKPSFRELQHPQGWTPSRTASDETLLNRRLKQLVAPMNDRIPLWQRQLAFFKIKSLKQPGNPVSAGDVNSLRAEVREASLSLGDALNAIPNSRQNSRVVDTERALASILESLETF